MLERPESKVAKLRVLATYKMLSVPDQRRLLWVCDEYERLTSALADAVGHSAELLFELSEHRTGEMERLGEDR